MIETDCRHHWLIEKPNGVTSPGRCKQCGARREFYNASRWERVQAAKLTKPESVKKFRDLIRGTHLSKPVDPNADLYVE